LSATLLVLAFLALVVPAVLDARAKRKEASQA
jgi:hypothetical protein